MLCCLNVLLLICSVCLCLPVAFIVFVVFLFWVACCLCLLLFVVRCFLLSARKHLLALDIKSGQCSLQEEAGLVVSFMFA